jgi:hypothetical protein
MKLVLDSGALIALERNDKRMWERYRRALVTGDEMVSHGGVLGQVWRRTGARQARLAIALTSIDVRGLDESLGRAAGELLGLARQDDVVDAALVLLAKDGDRILTSDPDDLEPLVEAADLDVDIVVV